MGSLTDALPKHLLEVGGKTVLERKFEILPDDVDEIVIVVGYLGGLIQRRFGGAWRGKRILYVEQENPTGGSADALWKAKGILKGRFLVMNGDNLYAAEDIRACLPHEWAVLVMKKKELGRAGEVVVDERGRIQGIVEAEGRGRAKGYANTGLYLLDTRIFEYTPVPKSEGSSELGLPQTMMLAAKDIRIQAVEASFWVEIKVPEDLQKAEELLADRTDGVSTGSPHRRKSAEI